LVSVDPIADYVRILATNIGSYQRVGQILRTYFIFKTYKPLGNFNRP